MSKRADNISRFVSGARNLALVQLVVGLTMLGGAAAGTYYVHKEIRADRMAEQTETKQAAVPPIVKPPIGTPPVGTISKSDYDELLKRAKEYYEGIEERNAIIARQNEQIKAGNTALGDNSKQIQQIKDELRSCQTKNTGDACPACAVCPAPIDTRPYTQEISSLKSQLASCNTAKTCRPPTPPCIYQGMPCLDAIERLQNNIRSKDCTADVTTATTKLKSQLSTCQQQVEKATCQVNGVPCLEVIANNDRIIAGLREELAAAIKSEKEPGTEFDLLEELKKIDPEQLQGLLQLLELSRD